MASYADEFRKEAHDAKGRPVERIVRGWKFILSAGQPPLTARQVWDMIQDHYKTGRASSYAVSLYEKLPKTFEEFEDRLAKEDRLKRSLGITDGEWTFSASLYPRFRSSTEKDWDYLGQMVAALKIPMEGLQTPIETTNPNDVFYWVWVEGE